MLLLKLLILQLSLSGVASFSSTSRSRTHSKSSTKINLVDNDEYENGNADKDVGGVGGVSKSRKQFLESVLISSAFMVAIPLSSPAPAGATERAIGAAEKRCREEGNCLEKFDIDGAVGWNWGGKDRCDATDPRCGLDGKLMESAPTGEAVPQSVDKNGEELKITNIVNIEVSLGKKEKGTLALGMYGDASPASVAQFIEFVQDGIVTTSKLMLEDGYGVSTAPIFFPIGGNLNVIYPQQRLDFGILSQGFAYARGRNLNKIPDNFVAQSRPKPDAISKETSIRTHSCAGLLSIPSKGLGYGGSGLESDDEAFASSFQITGNNVPAMDRESRKVIGQVMDESSMAFLARLASTPTRKGLKGIIPGQNAGPPLLKTSVTSVSVQ